jgi:TolB protein
MIRNTRLYIFWFALLLMMGACTPPDLRLPESPLLSVLERKSGLIAYVGSDGNIYTINQAGQKKVSITEDANIQSEDTDARKLYMFPTWSPDAEHLAFISATVDQEGLPTFSSLYTSSNKGNDVTEIYSSQIHFPVYAYWSPDSKQLGFLTVSIGGSVYSLRVVPGVGGEVQVLDLGQPYYWAWSPSNMKILAHVGGAMPEDAINSRLSLLTVNDPVTEVGIDLIPAPFQTPVFSPDGQFAVLAVDLEGDRQSLLLIDADGQVQSEITKLQGNVAFDWSPQGNRLAYVESPYMTGLSPGILNLISLDEPSNPQSIGIDVQNVIAFFWSPDGNQLAYFVPGQEPNESQENTDQDQSIPTFRVCVANAISGETQCIADFQPSLDFLEIIPFYDQFQRSATIWSPDSNYLVLSAFTQQGPGVFIVPASGAYAPRFLTEGRLAFWSWK